MGYTYDELTEETLSLLEQAEVFNLIGSERAPLSTRVTNEDATVRQLARLVGTINREPFRDIPAGKLMATGFAFDTAQHAEPAVYVSLTYSPLGWLDHGDIQLGDFSVLDDPRSP